MHPPHRSLHTPYVNLHTPGRKCTPLWPIVKLYKIKGSVGAGCQRPQSLLSSFAERRGTRTCLHFSRYDGLLKPIIDNCQQSYGLPSVANGLSHGLKIARQLSFFAVLRMNSTSHKNDASTSSIWCIALCAIWCKFASLIYDAKRSLMLRSNTSLTQWYH